MAEIFGFDCYSPREIAERVETVGVTKANLPFSSMVALGIIAGGFIGLGAMFAAFVAAGFEHSVANMYFIPLGVFLGADIGIAGVLHNLVPVTLGNLVGGSGMVGLVYHTIYRRGRTSSIPPSTPEKP